MLKKDLFQQFPVFDLCDIVLRELTNDDAEDYFHYITKPEMTPFVTEDNHPSTLAQAMNEVYYWARLFHNQRSFYWAIALKETNQLIGTAGFNIITLNHLRAEISYDLDLSFWGRGIMLKSVKRILMFADYIGLVRIQATVIKDNIRSINLLERCGFIQEAILKKYELVQGQHKDNYLYARLYEPV